MDDCKKITATAKEPVVNVRDGAKTVNSTLKEISTKLKTKCVRVDLKGLGEDWIPDPTLFRYNEDKLVSTDFLLKEFGRGIVDVASYTDSLLLNIGKNFADTSVGSDVLTVLVNWVRNVHDNGGYYGTGDGQDNYVEYQFKYIDILTVDLSKVLNEQGIATDIVSKVLSKTFTETSVTSDSLAKLLQPAKVETAIASDVLTAVVGFNLTLKDWAYLTDDVLGNANIDDDQYMSMNKGVLELMTYTDVLSTALTKVLSDSSTFTDVFSKSLSIVLVDSSPISETVSKSISTLKTELAVMSEVRTANLQNYMVPLYVAAGYIGTNYSI